MKNYFIHIFGCDIVGFFSSSVWMAHLLRGEVVIFGSLVAIMLNLTFVRKC